jgi:predicted dehydrogenase
LPRPRIAVVGTGQWGQSYVRVLARHAGLELTWLCDLSSAALGRAAKLAPTARLTERFADVLEARDVDAIVIATPARTHAALAIAAIRSGRHVLIEKPLALNVADALAVLNAAEAAGVVGMVGHLMVYHPAVQKLSELVHTGELGDIYYLSSCRANLGRARDDENALWSFGPHDVSMIDQLVKRAPTSVTARGECYLRPGIADIVFLNFAFGGPAPVPPLMAQVHLSWLNPRKERRLVVVGSKQMAEFDDCADDRLRIYDRGYDRPADFADFAEYLTLRNGGVSVVPIEISEPLAVEIQHFADCIVEHKSPATDLRSGLRIVRWLAAAQQSLEQNGMPVPIES